MLGCWERTWKRRTFSFGRYDRTIAMPAHQLQTRGPQHWKQVRQDNTCGQWCEDFACFQAQMCVCRVWAEWNSDLCFRQKCIGQCSNVRQPSVDPFISVHSILQLQHAPSPPQKTICVHMLTAQRGGWATGHFQPRRSHIKPRLWSLS